MKKIAIGLTAVLLLSGCETMGEIRGASSKGAAVAFSCEQIKNSFAAYNRDRQSLEALRLIATMTNTSTKGMTTATADSYYEKARNNANLALLLQGCEPL
jgi:uncharacterized protein YceK